jgi:hypothetical protein
MSIPTTHSLCVIAEEFDPPSLRHSLRQMSCSQMLSSALFIILVVFVNVAALCYSAAFRYD